MRSILRQAERYAATDWWGGDIPMDEHNVPLDKGRPVQDKYPEQVDLLKNELLKRRERGEIGPLDPADAHSYTDAFETAHGLWPEQGGSHA